MLLLFGIIFLSAFIAAGVLNHQGPAYYVISMGGLAAHLIWQFKTVDLKNPENCWSTSAQHANLTQ